MLKLAQARRIPRAEASKVLRGWDVVLLFKCRDVLGCRAEGTLPTPSIKTAQSATNLRSLNPTAPNRPWLQVQGLVSGFGFGD